MKLDLSHPFFQQLKAPFLLTVANAIVLQVAGAGQELSLLHSGVIIAMFWAGWRVNRAQWGNLKYAALAGPLVFTAGLLLVGGLLQVVFGDFSAAREAAAGTWVADWPRLGHILGLVLASILVAPVNILISLSGGKCAEYF